MKAVQYKLETCVSDSEDTLHVICSSEVRKSFCVLYIDSLLFRDLKEVFEMDQSQGANYQSIHWKFLKETWNKVGFNPVSSIFDCDSSVLFSTLTVRQDFGQKVALVSLFFPIGDCIFAAKYWGLPLFFTEAAESLVKKYDLSQLDQYVTGISKKRT